MAYATRAENLGRFFRAATPTLLGAFGVILWAAPLRLFEGQLPTPLLPLVVVYFWSIYSPSNLPAFGVFLIGIFQDLLAGAPLGLWPTIYLVAIYLVGTQRSYFHGRDQQVVWLGFAVIAVIASAILWSVMSLMSGERLPVGPLAIQMAATVALYPLIAGVFAEFHRRIVIEA
ncbi:MAG: rod shape-determining protein MreD [Alphaproteobacteria bacterium]|nr:rod shape-determining protein MreD [Alphaproteobacteria bacterium]